jgi:hypothetical protein
VSPDSNPVVLFISVEEKWKDSFKMLIKCRNRQL